MATNSAFAQSRLSLIRFFFKKLKGFVSRNSYFFVATSFRYHSTLILQVDQSINLFVYSPGDAERAVTAKLKRNDAICSVYVFTLIMSLVHLARRQRIDRAVIETTATC